MKLSNPWRDKTRKRLGRLTTPDLLLWADQAMVTSWQATEDFSRSGDRAVLDEAWKEAGVYFAILSELIDRDDRARRAF